MRRFSCPQCSTRIFFDDQTCLNCHAEVAYDVTADDLVLALVTCSHRFQWLCNWVAVPGTAQCASCASDVRATGPDALLTTFQNAKHRVLRQLIRLGLDPGAADPALHYELLHGTKDNPVTIGHADGLVTLDTSEADPSRREVVRRGLGEPYRTPIGHVRHETGHWHWQAYVSSDQMRLEQFRDLFGDDRADYSTALQVHYNSVDDGSWRDTYLTHYATAHPWEDYAESFAHVLHMVDMVETAVAEGFMRGEFHNFTGIYDRWAPLTVSLNEMADSMGTAQPYPFAPPAQALRKMAFVYDVISASGHARTIGG